jgi:hypothetical protein
MVASGGSRAIFTLRREEEGRREGVWKGSRGVAEKRRWDARLKGFASALKRLESGSFLTT